MSVKNEEVVERLARESYEAAMKERGFVAAPWDGPEKPQRTPFVGSWREGWRQAARAASEAPNGG